MERSLMMLHGALQVSIMKNRSPYIKLSGLGKLEQLADG